jgi:hypothetical protein
MDLQRMNVNNIVYMKAAYESGTGVDAHGSMRMGTSGTTWSRGLSLTAKNISTHIADEDVGVAGIRVVAELFAAAMKAVVEREFLARRTTHLARLHGSPGAC